MKGSKKSFIIQAAIWLVIMVSAIMLLPNTSQLIKDKGDTSLPSTVKSEVAQKIALILKKWTIFIQSVK